ncbi:hypothetical protein BRD00_13215 [Halobacteriales archaeon QS_8_69_26]|nr:MAG: hypothetical protein BRD00_13215 [Halobacteriales archaeon QS_8_69_26]
MSTVEARTGGFDRLSKSDIFDLLRNKRRRYLLHYLMSHDTPVELGDLATRIAAWENDTPIDSVSSQQRKRVYTTLQQTHLPRMDEANIVEYDADRGVVQRTEHTDKLNVYLEIVPRNEFPWREYYLALGAVCCGVVAALWAEVFPLTMLSNLGWLAIVSVVLTGSAAAHVYYERTNRLGAEELPPELDG